jgi:hypothetical protein
MVLLGLAVLYRYAPSRRSPQWKWISVGSAFATVTWLIGSALLSFYLANYAHYDATYGSLGAAIGLMVWVWMSTIVILLGAELNAQIEHQTKRTPRRVVQSRSVREMRRLPIRSAPPKPDSVGSDPQTANDNPFLIGGLKQTSLPTVGYAAPTSGRCSKRRDGDLMV